MRRPLQFLAAAVATIALAACGATDSGQSAATQSSTEGKMQIFATTGYLGDAAKVLAPEAEVIVMVKPGGDPHTYQPTTQDIEAMKSADLVLWNGLHLEALMTDQLEAQGDRQLEVGKNVPHELLLDWPETDDKGNPLHDPHIWNSPEIWKGVVLQISERLSKMDPAHADDYKKRADEYNAKIDAIDATAKEKFSKLSDDRRILVTGHDAFNYLGKTFGIEIHATDFVSSEAQITAADLDELAKIISEKKIPVIFQDNLANPGAIKHLKEAVKSKGWEVEISDKELYADSLGEAAPVDTYLGVFEYNVKAIVEALTPKK